MCRGMSRDPKNEDVFEFVISSKRIWRNLALLHTIWSSALNGRRQTESPNSRQKHHKNPQVIHNFSPPLKSLVKQKAAWL